MMNYHQVKMQVIVWSTRIYFCSFLQNFWPIKFFDFSFCQCFRGSNLLTLKDKIISTMLALQIKIEYSLRCSSFILVSCSLRKIFFMALFFHLHQVDWAFLFPKIPLLFSCLGSLAITSSRTSTLLFPTFCFQPS